MHGTQRGAKEEGKGQKRIDCMRQQKVRQNNRMRWILGNETEDLTWDSIVVPRLAK